MADFVNGAIAEIHGINTSLVTATSNSTVTIHSASDFTEPSFPCHVSTVIKLANNCSRHKLNDMDV